MSKTKETIFDREIDRTATGCAKWDERDTVFGRADVLPMWVADMDFRAPDAVVRSLTQRAEHGIYGYMSGRARDLSSAINWLSDRHALTIEPSWIGSSPAVLESLMVCLCALTKPGDMVAVQPPVYGPFFSIPEKASLRVYRNPLLHDATGWHMDLNQLEDGLKLGVKALILSSPHNPVGRVWTRNELTQLAELCARYGCVILSDEIHMDITMPGYAHTPILSVTDQAVMLISATKTFNIAGLRTSMYVIKDANLREKIDRERERMALGEPNLFGTIAQDAAYREGGKWLDELHAYLDGTRKMVEEYLDRHYPAITASRLEGTYLMWLDMSSLGLYGKDLVDFFAREAGVGLSGGTFFGKEGESYVRMNIGTQRRNVEKAISKMVKAVKNL